MVENMKLERWFNISILEDESQEDYKQRIQDVIEERFNLANYNSWHRYDCHENNHAIVEVNSEDVIMYRAADKSLFNNSIDRVHNQIEYEDCCEILRSLLKLAEQDIATALDGYLSSINLFSTKRNMIVQIKQKSITGNDISK